MLTAVPNARALVAYRLMVRAERRCRTDEAVTPEIASAKMTIPAWVCVEPPSSLPTRSAPSARKSPLVAHPAMITGTPAVNMRRRCGGTVNRGRRSPRRIWVFGTSSGVLHTTVATMRKASTSDPKTAVVGSEVRSRRSAAPRAPAPRPIIGPIVFHRAAMFRCDGDSKSIIIADSAGISRPAASPCKARATRSAARLPANQNMATLSASAKEPAATTGRRPTWSESGPR